MTYQSLDLSLKNAFCAVALDYLGAVSLDVSDSYVNYTQWLAEGNQADMMFLEKNLEVRQNPDKLLPGAKGAWIVGFQYNCGDRGWLNLPKPRVAQYARYKDYHKWMKKQCIQACEELKKIPDFADLSYEVCVDTKPLLERALAQKVAGGFIGKNTCFIHEEKGSWTLLGVILVNQNLNEDKASKNDEKTCGSCRRCQVHCPTGALSKDYVLDSRKCLSYQTIENRGLIDKEFWPYLKDYYYGCDICQLVCPFNKRVINRAGQDAKFSLQSLRTGVENIPIEDICVMDQAFYEKHFGGTPMTRAKRHGLRRNALLALYQMSLHAEGILRIEMLRKFKQCLDICLGDENEVVRGTAEAIFDDIGD